MKGTVTFTADLNDGGNGHSATFTLEDLGVTGDTLTDAEVELGVSHAYENWVNALNQGSYEIHE